MESGDSLKADAGSAPLDARAADSATRQPVLRPLRNQDLPRGGGQGRFVFVTEGVERTWEPENEDLAVIEDQLVELTEQVVADEIFEARPERWRCRWCKFAALCPAMDQASLEDLSAAADVVF